MKKLAAIVALSLHLTACATGMNMTPEMRRAAAAIPILTTEQVGGRAFTVISEVSGKSCARQAGSDPSMEAAREELKVGAAQRGANAVTAVLCKEGGVSLTSNCWKSIECRGDAIRWTS